MDRMFPDDMRELLKVVTRRYFFKQAGFGIGGAALLSLINPQAFATVPPGSAGRNPLAPRPPMFPAKAKNIIYLFMVGAPSQVDLLDHKPKLQEFNGEPIPEDIIKGQRFAFIKGDPKLLGSPFQFKKWGRSGSEISELLPHLGSVADDILIAKSLQTAQFNHAPAQIFMCTGFQIIGRPRDSSGKSPGSRALQFRQAERQNGRVAKKF